METAHVHTHQPLFRPFPSSSLACTPSSGSLLRQFSSGEFMRKRFSIRDSQEGCSSVVRESNGSVSSESSFAIRHSRREYTRSPVRNGASLQTPLIVSSYIVCNCNRSANKHSHPIQNSLLSVKEPQIRDSVMYGIVSLTHSTLLTADMFLLCTETPVPNSWLSFP
jgi:hypothetical protein